MDSQFIPIAVAVLAGAVVAGTVFFYVGRRRERQEAERAGRAATQRAEQIVRVHDMVARRFSFTPDAEKSIEVHPHVTTFEQVDTLASLGFDRISMGIQDLDEHWRVIAPSDHGFVSGTPLKVTQPNGRTVPARLGNVWLAKNDFTVFELSSPGFDRVVKTEQVKTA